MYWDEATREWVRHPGCTCRRDPCVCVGLPPLDHFGEPLQPYPIGDVLRASLKARQRLGYCPECGAMYESRFHREAVCDLCLARVVKK